MADIKLALQEYVATANNSEYGGDYDVINSKFPELKNIDPELLKEYVATANNEEYASDYEVINSKFPELVPGKSTDPAVAEAIVGSKGTDSESGDGLSGLQEGKAAEISSILKKYKGDFFAEESVAKDLRLALDGTDWDVAESNTMEKGGMNAITLKSEGGVEKTFTIGGNKDVSGDMINFINNNPTKSADYTVEKDEFMTNMDGYFTKDKIKELSGILSRYFHDDVNLSRTVNFCLVEHAKSLKKRRIGQTKLNFEAKLTGRKEGMEECLQAIERLSSVIFLNDSQKNQLKKEIEAKITAIEKHSPG